MATLDEIRHAAAEAGDVFEGLATADLEYLLTLAPNLLTDAVTDIIHARYIGGGTFPAGHQERRERGPFEAFNRAACELFVGKGAGEAMGDCLDHTKPVIRL